MWFYHQIYQPIFSSTQRSIVLLVTVYGLTFFWRPNLDTFPFAHSKTLLLCSPLTSIINFFFNCPILVTIHTCYNFFPLKKNPSLNLCPFCLWSFSSSPIYNSVFPSQSSVSLSQSISTTLASFIEVNADLILLNSWPSSCVMSQQFMTLEVLLPSWKGFLFSFQNTSLISFLTH